MSGVTYILETIHPITLTHDALEPDYYLKNSKLYFKDAELERSKGELALGIISLEKIRAEADTETNDLLSPSLKDLKLVYNLLPDKVDSVEQLTTPCIEVLLALTYMQIITAEELVKAEELSKAHKAIDFAKEHVKTALQMSEGDRRESEVMIYSEMNDITSDPSMSTEYVLSKIQKIKEATRKLEVSFFH